MKRKGPTASGRYSRPNQLLPTMPVSGFATALAAAFFFAGASAAATALRVGGIWRVLGGALGLTGPRPGHA